MLIEERRLVTKIKSLKRLEKIEKIEKYKNDFSGIDFFLICETLTYLLLQPIKLPNLLTPCVTEGPKMDPQNANAHCPPTNDWILPQILSDQS